MSIDSFQQASGGIWPYIIILIVGFLPTEIWRVIGVVAARRVDPQSEVLIWVQAVATVLVAGVVAKLMVAPSGALATIPATIRFIAIIVGLAAFFLLKRRIFPALLVGEAVLIGLSLLYR